MVMCRQRTFFREVPVLEALVDGVHEMIESPHDL